MQRYHRIAQSYPETRPAVKRGHDFDEIHMEFAAAKAAEQSSRCLQCGVPFCQVHCPLHNNIPDWLRLTAEGRLRDAYDMAASTNSFPEICGRICPQDKLCEGNCVVNNDFGAITIGSIEKYITETAWREGWVTPFAPAHENGRSVGIIGAGPAGLAAAEQLRRAGYAVHVYDRYDRGGGLLAYGIPNFKLDKQVVERRIAQFEQSGIVFHFGVDIKNPSPRRGEVGRGAWDVGELSQTMPPPQPSPYGGGGCMSFSSLRQKHSAVLIATGVYKARALDNLPGVNLEAVVPALGYLTASNRQGFGEALPMELNAAGRRVVVVGGGDTAMDCVRTAVRQGAKSVACLYRRDRENMPGSAREVKHAEEEGVTFAWLAVPQAFIGNKRVTDIQVQPMRLGPADESGRRLPVPVEDSSYTISADLVITALGFEAENLPQLFGEPQLTVTPAGTLAVDPNRMTSLPGVFAAGDIVRGASLVVWAIADGREAAKRITRYLEAKESAAAYAAAIPAIPG